MKIIESSKIKEKAYIEKLENGMDIIIIPKKNAIQKPSWICKNVDIIASPHAINQYFFSPNTQINAKNDKGAAVPKKTSGAKFNPKAILIRDGVIKHKDIINPTTNLFFLKNLIAIIVVTNAYNI